MAQIDPPPTYAGDLWSRPRLTGDWFGGRDWLAKRGVTFDLDLTQVLQGVTSGGRGIGVDYDGYVNYRPEGEQQRPQVDAEHGLVHPTSFAAPTAGGAWV
jgi:hypothetical protein